MTGSEGLGLGLLDLGFALGDQLGERRLGRGGLDAQSPEDLADVAAGTHGLSLDVLGVGADVAVDA